GLLPLHLSTHSRQALLRLALKASFIEAFRLFTAPSPFQCALKASFIEAYCPFTFPRTQGKLY
ncbi:hypothetical protein ACXWOD_09440, partial [Streptococcus pyogenes]